VIWVVVLPAISILAMWLAPRHWYGWAIGGLGEALWLAYALTVVHSTPLAIMACFYIVVQSRNALITRKAEHDPH
jgi:hypothetical protein